MTTHITKTIKGKVNELSFLSIEVVFTVKQTIIVLFMVKIYNQQTIGSILM